jgi:hypothetical protein
MPDEDENDMENGYLPHHTDVQAVWWMLGQKGSPAELAEPIVQQAGYDHSRRGLKVPDDPLHPANRVELEVYLEYC